MPILDYNDPAQMARYQKFLHDSPYAGFMQSPAWAEVKQEWDSVIVYIEEDEKITAGMQVLIRQIPLLRVSLLYAPQGPVCDPARLAVIQKLIEEAGPIAKKHRAFALIFDPKTPACEALAERYRQANFRVTGAGAARNRLIQPVYHMVLPLAGRSREAIIAGFCEKTRYNLRLSGRHGVEVRFSRREEDLLCFYGMYRITAERDRFFCRPYSYFRRMLYAYGEEELRIYIAEYGGTALCGAIAMNYGGELYYLYGASTNEQRRRMPNYAMQMAMIDWGLSTGCHTYHFGGLLKPSPENGLYRFKAGFCGSEGCIPYIGEIAYVWKKLPWRLYSVLLPRLRSVRQKIRGMHIR